MEQSGHDFLNARAYARAELKCHEFIPWYHKIQDHQNHLQSQTHRDQNAHHNAHHFGHSDHRNH